MPLHLQAEELLALRAAQRTKPLNEMTPEEARFVFRDFAALAGPPEPVASFCDLEVPGPAGAIPPPLYRASLDPESPVLVFFLCGWGGNRGLGGFFRRLPLPSSGRCGRRVFV